MTKTDLEKYSKVYEDLQNEFEKLVPAITTPGQSFAFDTARTAADLAQTLMCLRQSLQQAMQPQKPSHDWFLENLVRMVNESDSGLEIGITLQVGGFLVSGTMVGGPKYFEGFGSDFASAGLFAGDKDIAEGVRQSFAQHGEIYKAVPSEPSDSEKSEIGPLPLGFIHLKEARFFNTSGKPIPGNRGVWWRGRLSEVSGFILGNLSQE